VSSTSESRNPISGWRFICVAHVHEEIDGHTTGLLQKRPIILSYSLRTAGSSTTNPNGTQFAFVRGKACNSCWDGRFQSRELYYLWKLPGLLPRPKKIRSGNQYCDTTLEAKTYWSDSRDSCIQEAEITLCYSRTEAKRQNIRKQKSMAIFFIMATYLRGFILLAEVSLHDCATLIHVENIWDRIIQLTRLRGWNDRWDESIWLDPVIQFIIAVIEVDLYIRYMAKPATIDVDVW